jgi:DNA invertase Pin-like site-specific DNA recombinase
MLCGYARASTDGQGVDAQVRQLTEAGCTKVYREVVSGARTDSARLGRPLAALSIGDVLVAARLGRLARSTRDLLSIPAEPAIYLAGSPWRRMRPNWIAIRAPMGGPCPVPR